MLSSGSENETACVCWEGCCGTMRLFKGQQLGMTLTSPAVASIKSVAPTRAETKIARKRRRCGFRMWLMMEWLLSQLKLKDTKADLT